jgi:hypothetical protein
MKITHEGREIEAAPINICSTNETWSEYMLKDGTMIRGKLMLTRVYKSNEKTKEGIPVYQWFHQVVFDVVPEDKQH